MSRNLILPRHIFSDISTIGDLYWDNTQANNFETNTLEDTVRQRAGSDNILQDWEKVDGATAIPAQTYEIRMEWSPSHARLMPFLYGKRVGRGDPKNLFNDCMIHWGNSAKDVRGCIAVGSDDISRPDWISASVIAFNRLIPKIVTACHEGKLFLEITGGFTI